MFLIHLHQFLTRLLKANFPCRCITLEQASEFRLHVSFSGILYSLFLVQPSPTSPPHCVENFPRSSSPWSVLFRIFVDATETLHLLEHLCELRVPRPSRLTHKDRYKDTSTVSTSGPRATGRSQRLFENDMASSLPRSPPPDPSQRSKNGLEGALRAPRWIFKFEGKRAATGLSGGPMREVGVQKLGKSCSGSVRRLFRESKIHRI